MVMHYAMRICGKKMISFLSRLRHLFTSTAVSNLKTKKHLISPRMCASLDVLPSHISIKQRGTHQGDNLKEKIRTLIALNLLVLQ